MSKPTHELFYVETYIDRNGQEKKKRVVLAKGYKNQDRYNNNADYYQFYFGKEKLFVKEVRPDQPYKNQNGYQAQQRGYNAPPPAAPPPQSENDYGAVDPDIDF
jgi:hypothetical protein